MKIVKKMLFPLVGPVNKNFSIIPNLMVRRYIYLIVIEGIFLVRDLEIIVGIDHRLGQAEQRSE
jgi:hypothetical protein